MGPAEPGAGRTGRPAARPDIFDTPRAAPRGRGPVLVLAALSAASVVALAGAPTAAAAGPQYRFWTDWNGAGAGWSYAATGPAATHPADGAVEGWRYEVAADGAARAPRAAPSFTQLCSTTRALPGRVRVGVVLDYGTTGDTRPGQQPPPARGACARVPAGSDGVAVLAAVATIRFRADGLICAFDSYPSTGCVDLVGAAAPSPPPASDTPAPPSRSTATPTGRAPHSGRPVAIPTATGGPSAVGGGSRPAATGTHTNASASASTHSNASAGTASTHTTASSAPADAAATPTTRPAGGPGGRTATSRIPAPGRRPTPTVTPGRVASPTTTAGAGTATPAATPRPAAAAGVAGVAGPSAAALVLTGDRRPGGGVGGSGATSTAVGGGLVLLLGGAATTVAVRRRRRGTA